MSVFPLLPQFDSIPLSEAAVRLNRRSQRQRLYELLEMRPDQPVDAWLLSEPAGRAGELPGRTPAGVTPGSTGARSSGRGWLPP